jgi:hypothetical protein
LLDETRGFAGADRKLLPVDDGAGRIGDGKQLAVGRNRGLTVDDNRSDRIRAGNASGKAGHPCGGKKMPFAEAALNQCLSSSMQDIVIVGVLKPSGPGTNALASGAILQQFGLNRLRENRT